jgi:SET domain
MHSSTGTLVEDNNRCPNIVVLNVWLSSHSPQKTWFFRVHICGDASPSPARAEPGVIANNKSVRGRSVFMKPEYNIRKVPSSFIPHPLGKTSNSPYKTPSIVLTELQKTKKIMPKKTSRTSRTAKTKSKKQEFHSLERKKGLYLKITPEKFRGVFCKTRIKKGEEIESTPTIVLNEKETAHMEATIMRDYVFTLDKLSKPMLARSQVKNYKHGSTIIMGVATYCNHDKKPNAQLLWEERDGTLYHTLVALRDIPKDTEICQHMSN